jgi:SAM-dependent methyltransferase
MTRAEKQLVIGSLRKLGFELNVENKVWTKDSDGFSYSDGTVEKDLAQIIANAKDISANSDELEVKAIGWAKRYHLSKERHNLLRPLLPIIKDKRVLEIGSGCGALTSFLSENSKFVCAIEGSLNRAAITSSRVRFSKNVVVINSNIQDLHLPLKFDLVLVIGVLEYSPIYLGGEKSAQKFLEICRSYSGPNGKLALAIENQFGLKYFAGAPEDHIGIPFHGVENNYKKETARTYGRKRLNGLVSGAGYNKISFYGCFPDYKFPKTIVRDCAIKYESESLAELITLGFTADTQLPRNPHFQGQNSISSLIENELMLDLSNSFLLVANAGSGSAIPDKGDVAWHFSTNRIAKFSKYKTFVEEQGNLKFVRASKILKQIEKREVKLGHLKLLWSPKDEEYLEGTNYHKHFTALLGNEQWSIKELAEQVREFLGLVSGAFGCKFNQNLESVEIPGKAWDAMPWNLVQNSQTGRSDFFDLEWEASKPIPLSYFLLRLVYGFTSLKFCGQLREIRRVPSLQDIFLLLCKELSLEVQESELRYWLEIEINAQAQIYNSVPRLATRMKTFNTQSLGIRLNSRTSLQFWKKVILRCLPLTFVELILRFKVWLSRQICQNMSLRS